jgi:hypothetical protein
MAATRAPLIVRPRLSTASQTKGTTVVETIEGEVIESAVAVIEPREMLAETITPEGTVSLATRMATALKHIV